MDTVAAVDGGLERLNYGYESILNEWLFATVGRNYLK